MSGLNMLLTDFVVSLLGWINFELELFVYIPRTPPTTTIRRATQLRIQEQLPRVAAFLREQQVSAGRATTLYMATTQARLPQHHPLEVPTSTTFRQLQYMDEQQRMIDERAVAAVERHSEAYPLIHIMLHNEVPARENIRDLRRILGLPDWNLRPRFCTTGHEPVGSPLSASADIDDEEHKEDDRFSF
ncbi:unnamed protein product [Phytophthora fragariaefolia]|uniref:Unnamed protein product n=1 Tax=Phytophthora fragariaefolia TaxID=1490495 RepID=A0A9W6UC36_9STRA|nr:unnamed protein product [Phytophthora fragariaefolia]